MEKEKDAERNNENNKKGIKGLIASFSKLETKKKIQYVAILLIAIVILTIYFSSFKGGSSVNENPEPAPTSDKSTQVTAADDLEARLEETLSKIDGAGKVKVMITYESSPEIVPAYSVDKQNSSTTDTNKDGSNTTTSENTQSEVVTVNGSGGDTALVLKENNPKIMGVIVVAEGADSIEVRLNLLKAVETVLNVSPDKVDVYKMNNE
jgi:stage III sporulation protein AG